MFGSKNHSLLEDIAILSTFLDSEYGIYDTKYQPRKAATTEVSKPCNNRGPAPPCHYAYAKQYYTRDLLMLPNPLGFIKMRGVQNGRLCWEDIHLPLWTSSQTQGRHGRPCHFWHNPGAKMAWVEEWKRQYVTFASSFATVHVVRTTNQRAGHYWCYYTPYRTLTRSQEYPKPYSCHSVCLDFLCSSD